MMVDYVEGTSAMDEDINKDTTKGAEGDLVIQSLEEVGIDNQCRAKSREAYSYFFALIKVTRYFVDPQVVDGVLS